MASETSRSSSSARISLQSAMHSLQMYTDGPEMNFRTESFDFPQKEERRCLSCDMSARRQTFLPGKQPVLRVNGGSRNGQEQCAAALVAHRYAKLTSLCVQMGL